MGNLLNIQSIKLSDLIDEKFLEDVAPKPQNPLLSKEEEVIIQRYEFIWLIGVSAL